MRSSAVRQAIEPWVSMCACWTLGSRERAFVDGVRLGESRGHVAGLGLDFLEDVARAILDPGIDVLVAMDLRSAGKHGLLGVEHGGKHLVVHLHQPAALLRGGLGFGDHGGDPLADEPRDVVEHVGVVGIDAEVVVTGRREGSPRDVLPGEDGVDPRTASALSLRMAVMRACACGERTTLR